MKEKKSFHIGTGVTSMLMIFVILCLTTFGILSYTSANAEHKLTKKNADYVMNYYNGYSNGAKALAKLDKIIYIVREDENISDEKYYDSIEEEINKLAVEECTFEVTRQDDKLLVVISSDIYNGQQLALNVQINEKNDSKRYKVNSCYVKSSAGNISYEEALPDMWGE